MEFEFVFAWFDFWVGIYYDQKTKSVYCFPFPMLGIKISRKKTGFEEKEKTKNF